VRRLGRAQKRRARPTFRAAKKRKMPPTGGNACYAGQMAGGGKGPKVKERTNGAKQQLKLQTEDGQRNQSPTVPEPPTSTVMIKQRI